MQRQHLNRCNGLCETYSQALAEIYELIDNAENLGSNGRASIDGLSLSGGDPLSSSTNLYLNDAEEEADLKDTILRDIERTFPDVPFFRAKENQKMLAAILYMYARLHPDIGYRQGMHELAGPLLWVVAIDAETDADFKQFVQSDTLAMFEVIMCSARPWYLPGNPPAIVGKCTFIQNNILRQVDPELHRVLLSNNIEPQIWGIRWIRLIFGREFGFDGLLHLWDALFAADSSLALVDQVCVVILLSLRRQIMTSPHYSDILTLLLSSPLPFDMADLETSKYVARALYIKDHPTIEGGAFVAAQFDENAVSSGKSLVADTSFRTRSPNLLNFDSVREAARSVDRKVREALENKPRLPSLNAGRGSSPKTSFDGTCTHPARNVDLAKLLGEAISECDLPDAAIAKFTHIQACLLDDSIAISQLPSQKSSTPSSRESSAELAKSNNFGKSRSSLLGSSEFAWMLDSLDHKKTGFKTKT